jgi:hypothetical protein
VRAWLCVSDLEMPGGRLCIEHERRVVRIAREGDGDAYSARVSVVAFHEPNADELGSRTSSRSPP